MIRYSLFVFITVLAFESSPYAQECNWQDGIEIEDRGDFSGAIKVYNRCIELNPTDDWYYYCRARPKAKSGDYEGSISDYSTAIDLVLEREDVVPYYYYQTRAEVHMENGYLSKALTDFNKALKVKPDHLGIIFNKGIIKLKMDRPFEALQDFNNALDNGIFPGA